MARGPLGLSSSLWTAGERGTKGMEGAVPVLDGTAQPPALTAEAVDKRPTPTNATRAKNGPLRTTRKMFIFSPFRIESIRFDYRLREQVSAGSRRRSIPLESQLYPQ